MKCRLLTLLALLVVMFAATPAMAAEPPESFYQLGNWHLYGDSPHYLDLGVGLFDAGGNRENDLAARIELRIGKKLWFIGPMIGFLANLDGGYYGYGGIYMDIAYKKLIFTPQLAAGAYEEGGGKELGGVFQFRTSLGVAYQFDNLSRLGVQIAHISNADIHDFNPGEEEIFLTFAWPF